MHYKGMLRVARRDNGIRIYAVQQHGAGPDRRGRAARASRRARRYRGRRLYAPVPAASLSYIVSRLRYATPHWRARNHGRHSSAPGSGWRTPRSTATTGIGPSGPKRLPTTTSTACDLLAPFDPVVWDRRRFEMLWDWAYRFEAYTPAPKRKLGYYALPLLWRDRVIGWANVSVRDGTIVPEVGYVSGRAPRDRGFKPALERELDAMRTFLLPRLLNNK